MPTDPAVAVAVAAGLGSGLAGGWVGAPPTVRRWFLVGVLFVLNLLDMVTTRTVLALGGEELNPLMRSVVENFWHGVALKTAVVAAVALLLFCCPTDARRPERTVAAVCGLYVVVVLWNSGVILYASA